MSDDFFAPPPFNPETARAIVRRCAALTRFDPMISRWISLVPS